MTSLDEILVGASRTRSSDSLVTDSAAGATAFSCAIKTYNAAVGGMEAADRLFCALIQSLPVHSLSFVCTLITPLNVL